ncbi:hypothetical protein SDC9_205218 [bioreactor metagenome]|uniref:Uncharacterized protein n=1 Tax=bioreactor metagenome TaxID=1076179 RepID=A0A645JAN4_9ZZZZ
MARVILWAHTVRKTAYTVIILNGWIPKGMFMKAGGDMKTTLSLTMRVHILFMNILCLLRQNGFLPHIPPMAGGWMLRRILAAPCSLTIGFGVISGRLLKRQIRRLL